MLTDGIAAVAVCRGLVAVERGMPIGVFVMSVGCVVVDMAVVRGSEELVLA